MFRFHTKVYSNGIGEFNKVKIFSIFYNFYFLYIKQLQNKSFLTYLKFNYKLLYKNKKSKLFIMFIKKSVNKIFYITQKHKK